MKKNFTIFFILFILFGFINQINSQVLQRECVASGGTFMSSDGILIQQTIGQPYSTNTYYSNEISYRPGFQQPVFKIQLIQSTINLSVFPNPATRLVTIQSKDGSIKDVIIQVIDMSGRVLINQQISEFKSYSFNCEDWANGIYIISLSGSQSKRYSAKLEILK